jgi:hypothetical protein
VENSPCSPRQRPAQDFRSLISKLQWPAVYAEDEDDFEKVFFESLMHQVFGGEGEAAAAFREFELPGTDAMESTIDDLGTG